MRTVLVEDEAAQRARLAKCLRDLGLDVFDYADGSQALIEHLRDPFSLFVIDWIMPEMDGLQLCRRVRALPAGDRPYVLVVTARDQPEALAAVLDAGADDYIAKPAAEALLCTRVRIAQRRLERDANHRAAREALARSEADFRRVIERSPLGTIAQHEGTIVYANAAAGQIFDEAAAGLVGTRFIDRIHHDFREQMQGRARHFARGEAPPPPIEIELLRQDGRRCVVRCIPATAANYQGRRAQFTMLEDVTERRELRASLQQADRLASVGSMAAGVAHEISNPLAYAITNLELLGEELSGLERSNDADVILRLNGALDDALDGAQRVRRIVGDLKRFARTDDEEEPAYPVDMHAVLEVAVDISRNEILHRATLVRDFSEVPAVRGHEGRLAQVFVNLLVNAAHAVEGRTGIDNRIVLRTRLSDHGKVEVSVEDTGAGIPRNVLGHIFDPFFTTKPQGRGTGLGLSICHGIVTQMGGNIHVASREGSGTCVTVEFDADTAAPEPIVLRRSSQTVAAVRSLKILVVDDEPLVCEGIRRALRTHQVTVASSGGVAVKLCAQVDFDLVLCDVMMPGISGIEVYEQVSREHPVVASRFVFMTGGAFTPSARAFLESIGNEQIMKPFLLRDLRSLVARRTTDAAVAM